MTRCENFSRLILSATMRLQNDFRLLPLDILVTRECKIENIFPRLTTRESKWDFFHAWNIKLLTKTWNRQKFSHRVISMVYCSMVRTDKVFFDSAFCNNGFLLLSFNTLLSTKTWDSHPKKLQIGPWFQVFFSFDRKLVVPINVKTGFWEVNWLVTKKVNTTEQLLCW